jgi:hypothetical protein
MHVPLWYYKLAFDLLDACTQGRDREVEPTPDPGHRERCGLVQCAVGMGTWEWEKASAMHIVIKKQKHGGTWGLFLETKGRIYLHCYWKNTVIFSNITVSYTEYCLAS